MWFPDPFCLTSTYSFQNHLSDGNQMPGSMLTGGLCSQGVHRRGGKDTYVKAKCCSRAAGLHQRGWTQLGYLWERITLSLGRGEVISSGSSCSSWLGSGSAQWACTCTCPPSHPLWPLPRTPSGVWHISEGSDISQYLPGSSLINTIFRLASDWKEFIRRTFIRGGSTYLFHWH